MNKKQYNNVIENTLKHEQSEDSLGTARAIFNNMGVALPQGDIKTVYETIKTNNYMGWKSCTMQEAQAAADNGVAAIGISEDRIVVISANDEEQPVAQTASVMTLDENTSAFAVDGLQYYSYGYGTTTGGSTIGSGGSTTAPWKKAIIIVPGVTGTELMLASDTDNLSAGTKVWPPIEGGENFKDPSVLNHTLNKLTAIQCDSSGNSVYNLIVKNDNNYGALDTYKELYNYLNEEFGTDREIVFFGYDWRKPNNISGNLLKEKINEYSSVIIVAHSMGGLVTSHMLRDTTVRQKVEKVITLGTPYLGSLEMLPLLSHGHYGYIDYVLENLHPVLALIAKEIVLQPTLQAMAVNIPSLYELLPTQRYFSIDNRYYYSIKYLVAGTEHFTTFEATRTWLPIARDEDAIGTFNMNLFDIATNNHSLLWNNNSHITNNVDTYYIAGEQKTTISTYTFKDGFTDSYSTTSVNSGDGTVLLYSATMNDLYPQKTFFVTAGHNTLVQSNGILKFLKNIINGNNNLTSVMRTQPIESI